MCFFFLVVHYCRLSTVSLSNAWLIVFNVIKSITPTALLNAIGTSLYCKNQMAIEFDKWAAPTAKIRFGHVDVHHNFGNQFNFMFTIPW